MQKHADFFGLLHSPIVYFQLRGIFRLINVEDNELLTNLHHQVVIILRGKSSVYIVFSLELVDIIKV